MQAYVSDDSDTPLSRYISSVISTPRDEIALTYFDSSIPSPIFPLPAGFQELSDYRGTPGVYHFITSKGNDYVGSTTDLEGRLNGQHRPRGLNSNQTYRHTNLYGEVIKQG